MNVIGLPIGNMATASSRIRCYRFLKFIPFAVIGDEKANIEKSDVLFIQKRAYRHTIDFAKKAKDKGVKIIYDIDDDFGCWENMYELEMCNIADMVTTDTEERMKWLNERTNTKVVVIPDGIDYIDAKPDVRRNKNRISSVFTFGSNNGVFVASDMMNRLSGFNKYYYCAKPMREITNANFIRWDLNSFVPNIQRHDLALLAHDGEGSGARKSNNRLIVCMSVGMPALVSNTPAYAKTMTDIGLERLIIKDVSRINEQVAELEKDNMEEISKTMLNYAWDNFGPQKSSAALEKVMVELCIKK
jgi:hypothetical protein